MSKPKGCASVFDHLNETDKIELTLSFDQLAAIVVEKNYGVIRFLAALTRAMAKSPKRASRASLGPDKLYFELMKLIQQDLI